MMYNREKVLQHFAPTQIRSIQRIPTFRPRQTYRMPNKDTPSSSPNRAPSTERAEPGALDVPHKKDKNNNPRLQAASSLTDADFYHAFVKLSPEGIWRVEVDPPIPVDLTEDEQVNLLFERTEFIEGNFAFTKLLSLGDAALISGQRVHDLFPTLFAENQYLFRAIVRSGYHLVGAEVLQTTSTGGARWFTISFLGIIKDNSLQGGWGTLQEITETKRNNRIQTALYQISQATSSTQNLQELFKTIHQTLGELMPADNLFIALYDPATDLLTFPYFADENDPPPPPRRPARGMTEYVLRTGRPTLSDPMDFEHLVTIGEVENVGTPSIDWLGVPLVVQNQVIGVLAVQTYKEGIRFSEVERDLLVFVSNQIAMAIDRKRAEETLRMNEARFRAIVEDQTELICRFLPNGALTFVNEAFCRYYGKHREDLIGQPFIELIPDEYRPAVLRSFESLTAEIPSVITEHPGVKAGNFSTWEQWSVRAIFDDTGLLAEYQCVGRDMTERKKFEDELRYLSTHDSLTSIYNRAYFEEEMYRFQHSRQMPVSVVIADVDGLKEINDQFGHPTGDELLRQASTVLKNAFRAEDVVARIGGDEFGVLIPGADSEIAQRSVERIRKSLDAHNASPGNILVRLSLGFATAVKGEEIPDAFRQADSMMYQEKFQMRARRVQGILRGMKSGYP
jgi:diguanylate cyclase (GGDEF)-like protein/PAS domain S-box-containing protein